jgi:hypothetical protein
LRPTAPQFAFLELVLMLTELGMGFPVSEPDVVTEFPEFYFLTVPIVFKDVEKISPNLRNSCCNSIFCVLAKWSNLKFGNQNFSLSHFLALISCSILNYLFGCGYPTVFFFS